MLLFSEPIYRFHTDQLVPSRGDMVSATVGRAARHKSCREQSIYIEQLTIVCALYVMTYKGRLGFVRTIIRKIRMILELV